MRARPLRARSCGVSRESSRPCSSTRPLERTKPVMASMKVVLPAPLGPISPTRLPSGTSSSTSTSAWTPPKLTDTPSCAQRRRHDSLAVPAIAERWPPGAGVAPALAAAASFCCFFW